MTSPQDRVTVGGKRLTRRVWALLADARKAAGLPAGAARVVQGSWARGALSAGTHSGGGAFDLSTRGLSEAEAIRLVVELRRRNVAAWYRAPRFGWFRGNHIHGIVADEPGLAYGAQRQVINYRQGLNGLASKRRDPHPRPKQTPFAYGAASRVSKTVAVRLGNLRYGKRNADVGDLQKALGLKVDNWYGPVTDAAVRAHQRRMGLTPDPVGKSWIGPKQARALGLKVLA